MDEVLDNDLEALGANAPIIKKNTAIFKFSKLSQDELSGKLESFLQKKGYKLESGVPHEGTYGKGNKVMRVLFGAFVKRFEWKVGVVPVDGYTELSINKSAKGYAGGVVGVNQVNNEFKSIVNSLTQFHASQEAN